MNLQNPLLPVPRDEPESLPAVLPAGLTGGDVEMIRQSLDQSVSDNTKAAHASAWRNFEDWAEGRTARALPASPQLVAAYLSHLAQERRLSVATARLHKAANEKITPEGHALLGCDCPGRFRISSVNQL